MADMITRCPKCATAFRISGAVLSSAKGMVRCGSCLNVFNAQEHMEQLKKQTQSAPLGANPATAQSLSKKDASLFESFHYVAESESTKLFDKEDEALHLARSTTRSPRGFPTSLGLSSTTTSLFERESAVSTPDDAPPEDEHDEDESWALALLSEDEDEPDIQIKKVAEKSPDNAVAKPNESDMHDLDNFADLSATPPDEEDVQTVLEEDLPPLEAEQSDGSDSGPPVQKTQPSAQSNQHELASQVAGTPVSTGERSTSVPTDPNLEDEPDAGADRQEDVFRQGPERSVGSQGSSGKPMETKSAAVDTMEDRNSVEEAESNEPRGETETDPTAKTRELNIPQSPGSWRHENRPAAPGHKPKPVEKYNARQAEQAKPEPSITSALADLQPEPLEVAWDGEGKTWRKRLLWSSLALVALVALLLQIAWLQFHRLNRIEPYRSLYAVACEMVGCQLPELIDRSRISTSNLLVRTHPDAPEALLVDVILQNDATFEQPFPSLLLRFSDLQNRPVASRKLLPGEYLGGELGGHDLMPVKQPIHITVEIVDPGKDAVSYSIAIVD